MWVRGWEEILQELLPANAIKISNYIGFISKVLYPGLVGSRASLG